MLKLSKTATIIITISIIAYCPSLAESINTSEETENKNQSELCKTIKNNEIIENIICDQYIIDVLGSNISQPVIWLLEGLDRQINGAKDRFQSALGNRTIIQMIVIFAGLVTTISTAIAKSYPNRSFMRIDLSLLPIILSALVTALTSVEAYFRYAENAKRHDDVINALSELSSEIQFTIVMGASERNKEPIDRRFQIDEDVLAEWYKEAQAIMKSYAEERKFGS